jgi:tetratricopeptide (TPR) repeat protein
MAAPFVRHAPANATPDAQTRPALDESVRQLGSLDPRARDAATKALRTAGRSADAALRKAADSVDPEVAQRARALLAGIDRAAPDELEEPDSSEIDSYRGADNGSKPPIIDRLGRARGEAYRASLLTRLWVTEDHDELRAALFAAMLNEPAAAASALVARGDRPAARRLLEAALAQGKVGQAVEPYVAMCVLDGDLDAAIKRWSSPRASVATGPADADLPSDAEHDADKIAATVLARLRRAAGDPRGAVVAASRTGDPSMYAEALLDAGDWANLAASLESRTLAVTQARQLGVIAGALHLAGDARGFDAVVTRMRKLATPATSDQVAHTLLLCGRVDEALRTLAEGGVHDVELFKLRVARHQFDDAWKLVGARDAARDEPAMLLRLAAAEQLYATGDAAAAGTMLTRVAAENRAANVPEVHAGLGALSREMGRADAAWDHYRAAMRALAGIAGAGGEREWAVAQRAFDLGDREGADDDSPIRGGELWLLVSSRMQGDAFDQRFDRARAIVEDKVAIDELVRLADLSGNRRAGGRFRGERGVGDAFAAMNLSRLAARRMKAAGDEALATKYLTSVVERCSTPELATELYLEPGDWAAARGDFLKAAEWYGRAWNLDRTRSAALYLRAWAIGRAGWTRRAADLADLALALPLGDAGRRRETMLQLHRRGMRAELSREIDMTRRTTRGDLFAADDAVRAGDYLAAASLRERLLLNIMGGFELSEPVMYLRWPHTVHRERARGLLAKGDVDAAEREIAACHALLPGDVMLPIDVVAGLEARGMKARADELYAESKRALDAALAKYPGSANDHNNLAWLAVNCGRDAEAALSHARRAVELKPRNAAYLDTLAEVQYHRGEYDEAIKTMKRCAELQPREVRHREQIERFEAGKRGEQRPMPPS